MFQALDDDYDDVHDDKDNPKNQTSIACDICEQHCMFKIILQMTAALARSGRWWRGGRVGMASPSSTPASCSTASTATKMAP